jgi:hypothetical protein
LLTYKTKKKEMEKRDKKTSHRKKRRELKAESSNFPKSLLLTKRKPRSIRHA